MNERSNTPTGVNVNRKKQKRRQKQASKAATTQQQNLGSDYAQEDYDEAVAPAKQGFSTVPRDGPNSSYAESYLHGSDEFEPIDGAKMSYSDEENRYDYEPSFPTANGTSSYHVDDGGQGKKRSKKKNKSKQQATEHEFASQNQPLPHQDLHSSSAWSYAPPPPPPPPPMSDDALRSVHRSISRDPIWNTSTEEERPKIKSFWLILARKAQKGLLRLDKGDVLKKMKEQQKHSCSCSVCGRKRNAIEEELENLYDAYFQELEEFSRRNKGARPSFPPRRQYIPPARTNKGVNASSGRIRELRDDEEYGEGDEELSEDEYDDDYNIVSNAASDLSTFGDSLSVEEGGVLTVADEMLNDDGTRFIELMEQLAERRSQREDEAQFPSHRLAHGGPSSHYHPDQPAPAPPPEEDDYEEGDEDYESQEDEYDEEEEEDDMETMTEEQRMEEGRRMFQIFAARMFEQKILGSYREQVARERQMKLIEELEAEEGAANERDAKKARDAEKKKAKKQQQKQAKTEEKKRREMEKEAEEAAAREAEVKRLEDQKVKREEQRKKKEAERRAQEEERQRKDAERLRRQREERERQQEAERKAREQKVEEKRKKEEVRKKEREEREAKEQAARESKAQEEKTKKEKEAKAKAEAEAQERKRREDDAAQASQQAVSESSKRPSMPTIVALPPGIKSQKSVTSQPSPQKQITTPVIPKAPTPAARPRESPAQTSQSSAPGTPETGPTSKQASPPRPSAPSSNTSQPSSNVSRGPARQGHATHPPQPAQSHPIAPPPGMQQQNAPFAGFPPGSVNGLSRGQTPAMYGMQHGVPPGRQMNMYPHGPPVQYPQQQFTHPSGGGPPPGIPGQGVLGRGSAPEPLGVGLNQSHASSGPSQNQYQTSRDIMGGHSRQHSSSYDQIPREGPTVGAPSQPIGRPPQPIQRPSSAKPPEGDREKLKPVNTDIDGVTEALGSSALLDDSDEPLPSAQENRRPSVAPRMGPHPSLIGSPIDHGTAPFGPQGRQQSASNWNPSNPPHPFGPPTIPSTPGWGHAPGPSSWGNPHPFRGNNQRSTNARPMTVRILACQACQALSAQKGGHKQTFHDAMEVMRQIEAFNKSGPDQPIGIREFHQILDTEGDSHNGGGTFSVRTDASNRTEVKWEPDQMPAGARPPGSIGLGDIRGLPGGVIGRGF